MKRIIGVVKKIKPKKLYFQIFGIVTLTALILASAYFVSIEMQVNSKLRNFEGLVLPNVYINDYDLKGKQIEKLEEILSEKARVFNEEEIVFTYGEERFVHTFDDLGITINYQDILKEINNFLENLEIDEKIALIDGEEEKRFTFIATFNEEKKVQVLRAIEETINVEKIEPSLVRNSRGMEFNEGRDGKAFDFEANKLLLNELIGSGEVIELKVNAVPRTKDASAIREINTRLSTFSTRFDNSGGRAFNIRLATNRINGTIVMPGETFSFARVAGAPYLRAQGFRQAAVFNRGRIEHNYGGGICQVSTTLYGAQLRAGLTTVNRSQHSMPVSYVPRGLDAMVAFNSVDYRFRNNYSYPIYISAFTNGGTLTIEMWSSNRAAPNRRFEPHVVNTDENVYRTYLREYQNGRLVNTRFLHVSRYRNLPEGNP